jgi:hypothetical protein
VLIVAAGLLLAVAFSGLAGAVVPPKDCKTLTVNHHRYKIKADQIICRTARIYASRVLRSRTYHPPHFSCARYKRSQGSLAFRCENRHHHPAIQTIFAVR